MIISNHRDVASAVLGKLAQCLANTADAPVSLDLCVGATRVTVQVESAFGALSANDDLRLSTDEVRLVLAARAGKMQAIGAKAREVA